MKSLDLVTAGCMLLLAGLVIRGTSGLAYWNDGSPGPAFMAFWIAGVAALAALLLAFSALRRRSSVAVLWPDRAGRARVLATTVALAAFSMAVPVLGLIIAALLFMLTMLLIVQRRPLLPSLLTTLITLGLIELVFVVWLRIEWPSGLAGF